MQLIVASKNKKKLKELKKLLKIPQLAIKGLFDFDIKFPDVKEDKNTFIGNAKKKALTISKLVKNAIILADDSGLVVEVLSGEPGINSARYAGAAQDDNKNIAKLLSKLQGKANRKAYFISTVAIAKNSKIIGISEGRVYGTIIHEKAGTGGFGYDPIFVPKGYKSTFAQMNPHFKNRISHRYKAIKEAKSMIRKYLKK
ncbi:MAG: RdgB/HAM1 family non-canonical purine NTP pyrophosphatase [Candidatus Omnitrophica bacterium]|nr:RdgB/HAM1 family non-canonical purine NTP pyrophosphatase [Candidatus Omnitrophota bacterium]